MFSTRFPDRKTAFGRISKNRSRWKMLHCLIYEVLIPTEQITEVKNGKKTTVKRKFFPGYVLVRMELYDADGKLDENTWHFIHGIQGVISFSGGGEKPMADVAGGNDIWINHPAEQPRPPRLFLAKSVKPSESKTVRLRTFQVLLLKLIRKEGN